MGQSNSTIVRNYINNSTTVQNSVSSAIHANTNTSTTTQGNNTAIINVGSINECCTKGLNPDLAPSLQKIIVDECSKAVQNLEVNCDLSVTQKQVATVTVSQEVTAENNAQLKSAIQTSIKEQLNTISKQNNTASVLQSVFGGKNNSDTQNNIDNSIKSSLDISLSTDVQTRLRTVSGQTNLTKYNFCGGKIESKMCVIDQSTSINTYVTNIVSTVAESMANNQDMQNVANAVKTQNSQKNTNFIAGIIDSLGNIAMAWILLGLGLVALIGVTIIIVSLIRSTKSHHQIAYDANYRPTSGVSSDAMTRGVTGLSSNSYTHNPVMSSTGYSNTDKLFDHIDSLTNLANTGLNAYNVYHG